MFSISVTGVDRIIKKLKAYPKNLEEKNRVFLQRLAQIGIDTATLKFSQAQYDGHNDVEVAQTPHWEGDNTLYVRASGEAILFIEFGTGVHYVDYPADAKIQYERGTYGQGKGSNSKGWAYYGDMGENPTPPSRVLRETKDGRTVIKTRGNPPARAMYDAAKEMRSKIREIAREVYSGG